MGVNGLWSVLQPAARPTKIDTLNRKRLAIDASIWCYHFLKIFRDKEGNALRNSHVVGFFRRICKLLYFGIQPVFVFDGGAPALKRQTISGRKRRREGRRDDAVRTAGKLLALQMQRRAEEEDQRRREAQSRPAQRQEEAVPDELVYVDELQMTEQERQQNRKFKKTDQYHLPALDVSLAEMGGANDPRIMSIEELEHYARQFDSGEDINVYDFSKIDFNSTFFLSLPASDRYNILNAARLRSRLRMGLSKDQLDNMFPDRMAFSRFQIERVRERNELTQRLMHVNGMVSDGSFSTDGMSRVSGEKGREYVLVRNAGVEGGWALGVIGDKEAGERNKPIDVDETGLEIKDDIDDEDDDDDDFEDIPIEGLNRLPKVQPRSSGTSSLAKGEVTPQDILRRRKALYDSRRNEAQRISPRADNVVDGNVDALFVDGGFSAPEQADAQDDEDAAELERAIAMSLHPAARGSSVEEDDYDEVFKESDGNHAPPTNLGRQQTPKSAKPQSNKAASRTAMFQDSDDEDMEFEDVLDGPAKASNKQDALNQRVFPEKAATATTSQGKSAAEVEADKFGGPLPFEKLDLGSSILGKKKMDKIAQENAGGFEKEAVPSKKKSAAPLPPWFSGDLKEDMNAQKAIEAEDRQMEREADKDQFQFEVPTKLRRQDTTEVIDVDELGRETNIVIDVDSSGDEADAETTLPPAHASCPPANPFRSKVTPKNGIIFAVVPRSDDPSRPPEYAVEATIVGEGKQLRTQVQSRSLDNEVLPSYGSQATNPGFQACASTGRLLGRFARNPTAAYLKNQLLALRDGRYEESEPEDAGHASVETIAEGSGVRMGDVADLIRAEPPPRADAALREDDVRDEIDDGESTLKQTGLESEDDAFEWEESENEDAQVHQESNNVPLVPAGGAKTIPKTKSQTPEFENVDTAQQPATSPAAEGDTQVPVPLSGEADEYTAPGDTGVDDDEEQYFSEDDEDADLMNQLAEEAEEHARFASTLNNKSQRLNMEEYERELKALRTQQKKDRRDADEVTHVMVTECQQLLKLFGLPYITAPMEAEAQCAELVRLGLVDGIVTDDSDIFLFGGTRVYKNMFNQAKFVECYLSSDLEREFDLSRDRLIRIAHLLGSDYTEGLPGVGPVTALEILSEFPDGLDAFRAWCDRVQTGAPATPEDAASPFRRKFRRNTARLFLPPAFPDARVDAAYLEPDVDSDPSAFRWGVPDLDALRSFLMATIGWSQERTDEVLVPVIRDMNRRADEGTQANITRFLEGKGPQHGGAGAAPAQKAASVGAGAFAPRRKAQGKSKRMESALERMAESARRKRKRGGDEPEPADNGHDDGEDPDVVAGDDAVIAVPGSLVGQEPAESAVAGNKASRHGGRKSKSNASDDELDDEESDYGQSTSKKSVKSRKSKKRTKQTT